jgi:histidinol-phosphate/aromatic aminotransferase/cobyric acid decarboxylase-like protein
MSFTGLAVVVGVVTALLLLRFIVSLYISHKVPVEITGYTMYEQELKSYGINPHDLPEEFKRDVVSLCIKIAEVKNMTDPRGMAFKAELVTWIKFYAEHTKNYLSSPNRSMFKDTNEPFLALTIKHSLKGGF